MKKPEPMLDPCIGCDKTAVCATADTYKCPRFQEEFIRAWDETVSFLREVLDDVPEHP